jgi:hypothetical protein
MTMQVSLTANIDPTNSQQVGGHHGHHRCDGQDGQQSNQLQQIEQMIQSLLQQVSSLEGGQGNSQPGGNNSGLGGFMQIASMMMGGIAA